MDRVFLHNKTGKGDPVGTYDLENTISQNAGRQRIGSGDCIVIATNNNLVGRTGGCQDVLPSNAPTH